MDLRKLATDTAFSFGRLLLTVVRGLVVVPIITKLIGTGAYGVWAAVLGLVSIATALGSLDAGNALIRYTPEETEEGRVLTDLLLLVGAATVATVAVVVAADAVFGVIPAGSTRDLAVPAVVLIGVRSVSPIVRSYPRAINQVKTQELLNVVQTVAEIAGLAVVLFLTRDIVSALWVLITVTAVIDASTLAYYRPATGLPRLSDLRRYLTFTIPMLVQTLSSRTIRNADRYLLLVLASPTAAAVYAVCSSASKLVENFIEVINPSLYPQVVDAWTRNDIETLAELYSFILRWFVLLGVPAVAGMGLLAREILITFSTDAVADLGTVLLPITAFVFLVSGLNSPLVFLVNATEQNAVLSNSYLPAAVLSVVLNLALIPRFDVFGAVAATGVGYGIVTVYLVYWTRRRVAYRLPVVTTVRSVAATAVMAAAVLAAPPLGSTYLQMAVYPVAGATVYFATMAVIGGIPWSDINTVRQIVSTDG